MKVRLKAVALVLFGALALAACGSSGGSDAGGGGGGGGTVSIVGYSTVKAPYGDLGAAFAKTSAGKGVKFKGSYGASGDQSRAVESGQKADYVAFSLETDMTRLVKAGKVAASWNAGPNKGFVTDSVVAIVVRKGNPKNIKTWDDLIKPGIGIVTPNAGSSGSARWNILAAYSHVLADGGTEAQAQDYLKAFYKNVVAQPDSGRNATSAFSGGTGDVLISYENEAITARAKGEDFDYIVPDDTFLIQNPVAVTVGASASAKPFLDYALSKDGQTLFRSLGFRPVIDGITGDVKGANDPSDPFPTPKHLSTIDDLGGWKVVADKFFDENNGIVPKIQEETGKS